jgi:hypothetical protein
MADRAAVSSLVVVELADRLDGHVGCAADRLSVSNLVVVELADRHAGRHGRRPGGRRVSIGLDHEELAFEYDGRRFPLTDVAGEVSHEVIA